MRPRLLSLAPSARAAQVGSQRVITQRIVPAPLPAIEPIAESWNPSSEPPGSVLVALRRPTAISQPAEAPKAASIVAQTIEVEYPLASDQMEDWLALAARLQDAIKAADMAGLRDIPTGLGCSSCGGAVGECRVVFVRRMTTEERVRTLSLAVERARQAAAILSQAVGGQLGPLFELEREATDAFPFPPGIPGTRAAVPGPSATDELELVAVDPNELLIEQSVRATFTLLKHTAPISEAAP